MRTNRKDQQKKEKSATQEIADEIKAISFSDIKPEDYAVPDGWADQIAKENRKEKIKVTQLRKFFNHVKLIHRKAKSGSFDEERKNELFLLLPELAYAQGRGLITKDFYELMRSCLIQDKRCKFEKSAEFDNFVKFFEAILAYHKMYS